MSIAGLWERWKTPDGELHSYTMLTVNADDHALMQNFHKPGSEKRMVVILPNGLIQDWLRAPAERSMDFMRQYPADRLKPKLGHEHSQSEQLRWMLSNPKWCLRPHTRCAR